MCSKGAVGMIGKLDSHGNIFTATHEIGTGRKETNCAKMSIASIRRGVCPAATSTTELWMAHIVVVEGGAFGEVVCRVARPLAQMSKNASMETIKDVCLKEI